MKLNYLEIFSINSTSAFVNSWKLKFTPSILTITTMSNFPSNRLCSKKIDFNLLLTLFRFGAEPILFGVTTNSLAMTAFFGAAKKRILAASDRLLMLLNNSLISVFENLKKVVGIYLPSLALTANLFLPLALRRAKTLRPSVVAILALKPCFLFLFLRFNLNV